MSKDEEMKTEIWLVQAGMTQIRNIGFFHDEEKAETKTMETVKEMKQHGWKFERLHPLSDHWIGKRPDMKAQYLVSMMKVEVE